MTSLPFTEFRRNMKKYLSEGVPFVVESHGRPIAKIVPIEIRVENKVWPTCEMGRLTAKMPCTSDSNGKYKVTLTTDTDVKHWELNLCPDHVKIIEKKDGMEVEKI